MAPGWASGICNPAPRPRHRRSPPLPPGRRPPDPPSIIVAIIDTGVIADHPDLQSKLLPGYDFVSCDQGNTTDTATCSASGSAATYYISNDGEGWHSGAVRSGDWISTADAAHDPVPERRLQHRGR